MFLLTFWCFFFYYYITDTLKKINILFQWRLSQKTRNRIKIFSNQFCMLKNNWIFQSDCIQRVSYKWTMVNRWMRIRRKKPRRLAFRATTVAEPCVSPRPPFPDRELATLKMAPVVNHEAAMINVKKHPGTVESYWDDKSWSIKGSVLKEKTQRKKWRKKNIYTRHP